MSLKAEDNLNKGRGFRMMNVLQHSSDFRDDQPVARIRFLITIFLIINLPLLIIDYLIYF